MNFNQYVLDEVLRHGSAMPQDLVKLCFQAAFGAEHLLEDVVSAKGYFYTEFERVIANNASPMVEHISNTVDRVNLAAWKAAQLPPEWLFNLFVESTHAEMEVSGKVNNADGLYHDSHSATTIFATYISQVSELVETEQLPFSYDEWETYLLGYLAKHSIPAKVKPFADELFMHQKLSAVHHSEKYRAAEKPAYRIISGNCRRLVPILAAAGQLNSTKNGGIIAIDGRAAAGKSTLAAGLAQIIGAGVIHMDDFFLPHELRTADRLQATGGNVHYERFSQEVLPFLTKGNQDAFVYNIFDCRIMAINGQREVKKSPWRVVEGAYSHSPQLGNYMDLRVFASVDSTEQLRRIATRNGVNAVEMFEQRWIPMEERYIAELDIEAKAKILV